MSHLRRKLLLWYDRSRRDLAWRSTREPYAIWLAEIMLQQTQVKTVEPFYEKFLKRFPDVRSLANAPLDDVLGRWAGLGYYRRAEHLHRAAKIIVQKHRGKFPPDFESILALPGVGRYTAAAVASIAFGEPVAVLDGNVIRVLCRLLDLRRDPARPEVRKALWETAQALIPADRPGDYNQAMMELGATVCTPKNPACPNCPVKIYCRAFQAGNPGRLPMKSRKPARKILRRQVFVIQQGNRVLLLKRPGQGLWAGLWEFPAFPPLKQGGKPGGREKRLRQELGLEVKLSGKSRLVRHELTHRAVICRVFSGRGLGKKTPRPRLPACDRGRYQSFRWVPLSRLDDLPISALTRKIAAATLLRSS